MHTSSTSCDHQCNSGLKTGRHNKKNSSRVKLRPSVDRKRSNAQDKLDWKECGRVRVETRELFRIVGESVSGTAPIEPAFNMCISRVHCCWTTSFS